MTLMNLPVMRKRRFFPEGAGPFLRLRLMEVLGAVLLAGGLQAAMALKAPGEIFANLLVFHSLSKRSSAPGLRSGFVAGDAKLVELIARLRSYGGASVPAPIMAASTALWRDEKHVEDVRARYNSCFDVAAQFLHNRFDFFRPDGGFFLWLDVGDGEAATRTLWGEAGVKVLPGLYLANTTQIYPEDRGTNYSVRLGNRIAALVADDLASERRGG